ncbi:hypothetical protein AB1Y20_014938 [Prymnesium parvum]|uniref:Uncharacterized protein n=1 Tax=Prymnesium parvum TaxID=97485 RepID=A0AB34JZ43_PRYPA
MGGSEYRSVSTEEGGVEKRRPQGSACPQWACLLGLALTGAVALGHDLLRPEASLLLQQRTVHSAYAAGNGTMGTGRRRRRKFAMASALGRMGTSSSFLLRSHRQKRRHQAKAASKSVLLVGSHFELGNELLKRVFGELCKKNRLGLRCEPKWGSQHDLKSLAEYKGKKRLVWLDQDAAMLRETIHGVEKYAFNVQLLHLLWDPREACAAQWPHTLSRNHTLLELCHGLQLDQLPALYRYIKRERAKGRAVLQKRLEQLASRKTGKEHWAQVFKWLGLVERNGDLSSLAVAQAQAMRLRHHVYNFGSPGWVHAELMRNSSLHSHLKKIRRELEYKNKAKVPTS